MPTDPQRQPERLVFVAVKLTNTLAVSVFYCMDWPFDIIEGKHRLAIPCLFLYKIKAFSITDGEIQNGGISAVG